MLLCVARCPDCDGRMLMDTFDEAYAGYLKILARLDGTDDISEKNLLFRQLTQLLSDLERRVNSTEMHVDRDGLVNDEWEQLLEPTHSFGRQTRS